MALRRAGRPGVATRGAGPSRADRGWRFGLAFLVLQVAWVLASQARESRHFSWAPHTVQVRYAIAVEAGGRALAPAEVAARYGVPDAGWEAHSHRNLIELIEQAERGRGAPDVRVQLDYRINEGPPARWQWP